MSILMVVLLVLFAGWVVNAVVFGVMISKNTDPNGIMGFGPILFLCVIPWAVPLLFCFGWIMSKCFPGGRL